jgi:DUF2924 family protein
MSPCHVSVTSPPFSPQATSGCSAEARRIPQLPTRACLVAAQIPGPTLRWMLPRKRAFIVPMDATTEREPVAALIARLAEIQTLSTGQLRAEFQHLSGRPTGSWNRDWLRRKVSWLIQESRRQDSDGVELPTIVPEVRDQPRSPRLDAPIQMLPSRGVRDPRLPKPGQVLVREYRGLKLTVTVLEQGFDWNGQLFPSLTAVARAITGQHWSGPFFFNLRPRKRSAR